MSFSHYQQRALTTANYPEIGANPYYPAIGLGGEAGEVLNQVKKIMRDDGGNCNDERKEKIFDEMGDVLWYLAVLANEFGFDLSDVAGHNLEKLAKRKAKGLIQGDGDNR